MQNGGRAQRKLSWNCKLFTAKENDVREILCTEIRKKKDPTAQPVSARQPTGNSK